MVRGLRFHGDGIHFLSRFVGTRKLKEEEEREWPLYRTFGSSFDGNRLRRGGTLEPPVNVSVYPLGSRLLAFAEQSIPSEPHPQTLDSIGAFDFHGRLNEVSPFAAHAKFDPERNRMRRGRGTGHAEVGGQVTRIGTRGSRDPSGTTRLSRRIFHCGRQRPAGSGQR